MLNLAKVRQNFFYNLRKVRLRTMKYENEKYYHVYNRGANRDNIFLSPDNYRYCINLFAKYYLHYKVSIHAFCLMPNHYHLLIRQIADGSISKFIQIVFNSYSQAVNTATGHSGTLFQGRAKGKEITTDDYAVRLCRYIHYNHVVANLVKTPEEWEFSDYLEWIEKRRSAFIDFSLRDGYFGSAAKYQKFAKEYKNDNAIQQFIFKK